MSNFLWTDDPADPCPLCVHWVEPEQMDSSNFDEAWPMLPDGQPAERVFGYTHDACEKAVMEYVAESSHV